MYRATSLPTDVGGGYGSLPPSPTDPGLADHPYRTSPTRFTDPSPVQSATTFACSLPPSSPRSPDFGSPPRSETDSGYSSMAPSEKNSPYSSPQRSPTDLAYSSFLPTSPLLSGLQYRSFGALSPVSASYVGNRTPSFDSTIGHTPPAQQDQFKWTSPDRSHPVSSVSTADTSPSLTSSPPDSPVYKF
jgi:hypothetical protein